MKQIKIPYTDANEISKFCKECLQEDFITVDTEFVRTDTLFPKLCLIQVAICLIELSI